MNEDLSPSGEKGGIEWMPFFDLLCDIPGHRYNRFSVAEHETQLNGENPSQRRILPSRDGILRDVPFSALTAFITTF